MHSEILDFELEEPITALPLNEVISFFNYKINNETYPVQIRRVSENTCSVMIPSLNYFPLNLQNVSCYYIMYQGFLLERMIKVLEHTKLGLKGSSTTVDHIQDLFISFSVEAATIEELSNKIEDFFSIMDKKVKEEWESFTKKVNFTNNSKQMVDISIVDHLLDEKYIVFINHTRMQNWENSTIDFPYGKFNEVKNEELTEIPYIRNYYESSEDNSEKDQLWSNVLLITSVISGNEAELGITIMDPMNSYPGERDAYMSTLQDVVKLREDLKLENQAYGPESYELYEAIQEDCPGVNYEFVGPVGFSCTVKAETYGEIIKQAEKLLLDLDYWTKFQLGK